MLPESWPLPNRAHRDPPPRHRPQPGLALLNHRSGQPDPAANTPADLYPLEAFQEALEFSSGLPYSSRGPVRSPAVVPGTPAAAAGDAPAASPELAEEPSGADPATVNSADYQAIVKAYTNKKGETSYDLLNKALIQAARSNPHRPGPPDFSRANLAGAHLRGYCP